MLSLPKIMGVLNITPDSFSDGGQFLSPQAAIQRAEMMLKEGADIIDIGAESSRPGAVPLPLQQELDRLLPVLEALQGFFLPISVDTYKPQVMDAAAALGASILNDITGFISPESISVLQKYPAVSACVMHMQNQPTSMQQAPVYENVVDAVMVFFEERMATLSQHGIDASRIILDPGFGFGKTLEHNISLMQALPVFKRLGLSLLVGVSRKSMIGQLTHQTDPSKRLAGSLAAACVAFQAGANILRVHDVRETKDALLVWQACYQT